MQPIFSILPYITTRDNDKKVVLINFSRWTTMLDSFLWVIDSQKWIDSKLQCGKYLAEIVRNLSLAFFIKVLVKIEAF